MILVRHPESSGDALRFGAPPGRFCRAGHTTSRISLRCRAAAPRFKKYSNDNINPKINKPSTRVSINWLLQIPYSTPATITKGRIAVNGPNPNTLVALRRSVDGIVLNARLAITATAYGRKIHSILSAASSKSRTKPD